MNVDPPDHDIGLAYRSLDKGNIKTSITIKYLYIPIGGIIP